MTVEILPHAFFTLSDGGKLRYAQFDPSTAIRGSVLVVPGRREFIEKKFAEVGANLLELGFRLIIMEPRGQGLSSRFMPADKHQRDHVEDFTTHLNDLRSFYNGLVLPSLVGPLLVHGHSLGGHMLLRWLAEDRPKVAGAFVTAPMLALASMPSQLTAYGISWVSTRLFGHATDYAPTQHDFGDADRSFANNPLTHDPERFLIIEKYFKAFPDLTVGGVTWGWLLAALRSMHIAHGWNYLARIDIPVLALTGGEDQVTPHREISGYLNLIPRVRTHVIEKARHDVLNETEELRNEAWQRINSFLKTIIVD